MTNFKTTRRALVSSVLALVMCFTMLLGTTFAWFTDSVTSGGNIIQTGNLKIELEYYNGTEWKSVQGASDILKDGLWEPGYTDVAYLRMKNVGSLDLKYQLGVEITETEGVNRAGETFKLSDYIYFDVIEGVDGQTSAYATRDAALAAVTDAELISAGYAKADKLEAGSDYLYLAMVVYMPTSVGNEASHNGTDIPEINMTVSVLATQLNSEEDSFGPDYDEDAWLSGMKVYNENDLLLAIASQEKIVLADNITLTNVLEIPADANIALNLNGKTISGEAESNESVIHNNGTLVILGGEIKNTTENGGYTLGNNGVLTLQDVTVTGAPMGATGYPAYTLHSNGTLNVEEGTVINSNRGALYLWGGETTINGGEFVLSDAAAGVIGTAHVVYAYSGSTLTINGGYFENKLPADGGSSVICPSGGSITIHGGTFNYSGAHTNVQTGVFQNYMGYSAPVVVYGGSYSDETVSKWIAEGYATSKTYTADGIVFYNVNMESAIEGGVGIRIEEGATAEIVGEEVSGKVENVNAEVTVTDTSINTDGNKAYGGTSRGEDAYTVYENVNIYTKGGGINVLEGADVLFVSGTVDIQNVKSRHLFYVGSEGEKSELIIEDGTFNLKNKKVTSSYVVAAGNAVVYIKGGNFAAAANKAPIQEVNGGEVIITGGTFAWDPTEWVADGYVATEVNGIWTVTAE